MKHKLLLSGSRRWGNISNTAHSFSSFAHSFGHLKLLVLSRGGRSKQLLLALPHLIPAAKFRELKCSALSSLLAPPQSTSVVNFPPGTRDDALLDYISEDSSGAVRAQSLTQKETVLGFNRLGVPHLGQTVSLW